MSNLPANKKFITSNRGIILPVALIVLGVTSIIALSLSLIGYYHMKNSSYINDRIIASYAVDSALASIKQKIEAIPSPREDFAYQATYSTENYTQPVCYTAKVNFSAKDNCLINLEVFIPSKDNPRYRRKFLVVDGLIVPQ